MENISQKLGQWLTEYLLIMCKHAGLINRDILEKYPETKIMEMKSWLILRPATEVQHYNKLKFQY